MHLRQADVALQTVRVGSHIPPAACIVNAKVHNHHQGNGHDDTLNQVGSRYCQKTAQHSVGNDNRRTDQHCHMILYTEQALKQSADGLKTGSGIGHEKDNDNDGCNTGQKILLIPVSLGEEIGNRDGSCLHRIAAQPLGNEQPVQIGTQCQSDGGPACICHAGQICYPGQSHQQPAAHVGSLGTHRSHQCSQFSSAQIEVIGSLTAALLVGI